jgi:hypothetical protein
MGEVYGHASEWNLEKEKIKARGQKSKPGWIHIYVCTYMLFNLTI